jgi:hypothetical protein
MPVILESSTGLEVTQAWSDLAVATENENQHDLISCSPSEMLEMLIRGASLSRWIRAQLSLTNSVLSSRHFSGTSLCVGPAHSTYVPARPDLASADCRSNESLCWPLSPMVRTRCTPLYRDCMSGPDRLVRPHALLLCSVGRIPLSATGVPHAASTGAKQPAPREARWTCVLTLQAGNLCVCGPHQTTNEHDHVRRPVNK